MSVEWRGAWSALLPLLLHHNAMLRLALAGRINRGNPNQIVFCGAKLQRGLVDLSRKPDKLSFALSVGVDACIQFAHAGKAVSDMDINQRIEDRLSFGVGHGKLDGARSYFSVHHWNIVSGLG